MEKKVRQCFIENYTQIQNVKSSLLLIRFISNVHCFIRKKKNSFH